MKAIEINDATFYYGDLLVLDNINLEIDKQQFLGIIGPNGGGKSTLIKLVLGLEKLNRGNIKIFGNPPGQQACSLGYVPQFTKFDRNFPATVREVVLMGRIKDHLTIYQSYNKRDYRVIKTILKRLGIYNLKNRQIGNLSVGQLQRVLIARALALNPDILLLDEPTAGIDAESRTLIYSILKQLNKDITIIVVTHDLAAVSAYFDSIACLNVKLYYHGDKKIDNELVREVYGCPIDLIAHGVPHRVLRKHVEGFYDS